MNITVTMETRFCSLESLKKQTQAYDFKFLKGDKIKIIFARKLSPELYGSICYYLASCILSSWENTTSEMALEVCLERAKGELREKGVNI